MSDAETIRGYFEPFLDLDPTRYDDVIRDLDGAIAALEHKNMGKIDDVGNDLSDWQGSAADSFNEERLATFKPITQNQVKLASELVLATAASREIAVKTQKDIITIVMGLEGALEALDSNGCGCSKDQLTKILGIVAAIAAAIAGIGAILGAIGAGAAAGSVAASAGIAGSRIGAGNASLGLLAAVGGAANNFKSTPEEIVLKGETVEEILKSAHDAIEKLNKGIDDQENKLKKALEEDVALLKEEDMQIKDIELAACDFRPPP